ncbi:glycosyltransferase family 87 protein [Tropicimonas sp.]|uniref:glycosyltransferase family 87 protein n=1 Tax=Tropicimonas sp. TaxID=2067044 RepID=UPI003A8359CF
MDRNTWRGADIALFAVSAAVGLSYLVLKAWVEDIRLLDFPFIWWAGDLWAAGRNPYGPDFQTIDAGVWSGYAYVRDKWFFYPPHWWAIARPAALLPLEQAALLWRLFTAACYLGGSLVVARAVHRTLGAMSRSRLGALLLFACASSATAIVLSIGQTTGILFLGLCLFCAAWLERSGPAMTAALVLLALKPNFGLAFWAFAIASGLCWGSIGAAVLMGTAIGLPALLPFGPVAVLRAYFRQLGHFGDLVANSPANTTGLGNLLERAGGMALSPTMLALAGAAAAAALGWWAGRADRRDPAVQAAIPGLLLALSLLCVSMHVYDATLLAPLIVLCLPAPAGLQLATGLGCLIVFRADNLAELSGIADGRAGIFPSSLLVSWGYLGLAVAGAAILAAALRRRPAPQALERGAE